MAKEDTEETQSVNIDGMQSSHCSIPRTANHESKYEFSQNVVGMKDHGANTINLTSHLSFLKHDANVLIQCLLLGLVKDLRSRSSQNKATPHTLFIQIDGGECTKALFAILYLLVASRCYGRIVVTRLPVGHSKLLQKPIR